MNKYFYLIFVHISYVFGCEDSEVSYMNQCIPSSCFVTYIPKLREIDRNDRNYRNDRNDRNDLQLSAKYFNQTHPLLIELEINDNLKNILKIFNPDSCIDYQIFQDTFLNQYKQFEILDTEIILQNTTKLQFYIPKDNLTYFYVHNYQISNQVLFGYFSIDFKLLELTLSSYKFEIFYLKKELIETQLLKQFTYDSDYKVKIPYIQFCHNISCNTYQNSQEIQNIQPLKNITIILDYQQSQADIIPIAVSMLGQYKDKRYVVQNNNITKTKNDQFVIINFQSPYQKASFDLYLEYLWNEPPDLFKINNNTRYSVMKIGEIFVNGFDYDFSCGSSSYPRKISKKEVTELVLRYFLFLKI